MRHDDARHALYVSVPSTRETFAVRRLPPSLTVSTLRARLELCAGLATGTYVLRHGRTPLADDARLTFGENVANGAVLTAVFEARWVRVYGGVVGGAGGGRQRRGGAETPHPPDSHAPDVSERRFVALFALSHRGLHPAVQRLISLDDSLVRRQTAFGRTALHAAVAEDRIEIVHALIARGADVRATDAFRRTPLDVAIARNAYACERILRHRLLQRYDAADKTTQMTTPRNTNTADKSTLNDDIPEKETHGSARVSSDGPAADKTSCFKSPRDHASKAYVITLETKPFNCDVIRPTTVNVTKAIGREKTAKYVAVSKRTSTRAQSAKYYHSKYHCVVDEFQPEANRPATVNTRYRSWKTWLHEADGQSDVISDTERHRQLRNADTFRQWLIHKAAQARRGVDDVDTSDSDDDVTPDSRRSRPTAADSPAYVAWLDRKRDVFAQTAARKREAVATRAAATDAVRRGARAHSDAANRYATDYDDWRARRRAYEARRAATAATADADDDDRPEVLTRATLNDMRTTLQLSGMTYGEWLGLKRLERHLASGTAPRRERTRRDDTRSNNVVCFVSE